MVHLCSGGGSQKCRRTLKYRLMCRDSWSPPPNRGPGVTHSGPWERLGGCAGDTRSQPGGRAKAAGEAGGPWSKSQEPHGKSWGMGMPLRRPPQAGCRVAQTVSAGSCTGPFLVPSVGSPPHPGRRWCVTQTRGTQTPTLPQLQTSSDVRGTTDILLFPCPASPHCPGGLDEHGTLVTPGSSTPSSSPPSSRGWCFPGRPPL